VLTTNINNLLNNTIIMQICYVPVSKIESEELVWAASRGMGERRTGNSKF